MSMQNTISFCILLYFYVKMATFLVSLFSFLLRDLQLLILDASCQKLNSTQIYHQIHFSTKSNKTKIFGLSATNSHKDSANAFRWGHTFQNIHVFFSKFTTFASPFFFIFFSFLLAADLHVLLEYKHRNLNYNA
jgi:hypothetical protein